ncbi:hypothetical protein [Amycolatopsis sp. NPDC051128]|uniref:hypothetical protein n=1 Tax=Amycolatopsis sp. NPDC051128 TaxID=3155412 RepID=UPI00341650E8
MGRHARDEEPVPHPVDRAPRVPGEGRPHPESSRADGIPAAQRTADRGAASDAFRKPGRSSISDAFRIAGRRPATGSAPVPGRGETGSHPATGRGESTGSYFVSAGGETPGGYPAAGHGDSAGAYPAAGRNDSSGSYPATGPGAYPVTTRGETSGTYPAAGRGETSGTYPAAGRNDSSGSYPAAGRGETSSAYPVAGHGETSGAYPAAGPGRGGASGGRRSKRSAPASGRGKSGVTPPDETAAERTEVIIRQDETSGNFPVVTPSESSGSFRAARREKAAGTSRPAGRGETTGSHRTPGRAETTGPQRTAGRSETTGSHRTAGKVEATGSHRIVGKKAPRRRIATWPIACLVLAALIGLGVIGWNWADSELNNRAEAQAASCSGGTSHMRVVVTPSVQKPLAAAADRWNQAATVVHGQCVHVMIEPKPSAQVLDALVGRAGLDTIGGLPAAWLPESSYWVSELTTKKPEMIGSPAQSVANARSADYPFIGLTGQGIDDTVLRAAQTFREFLEQPAQQADFAAAGIKSA